MDPPEVSFQMRHDQLANDGIRISSTNDQAQSSAPGSALIVDVGLYLPGPAPNGAEVLNRGEDNGNFECVLHSSSVNSYLNSRPVCRAGLPSRSHFRKRMIVSSHSVGRPMSLWT